MCEEVKILTAALEAIITTGVIDEKLKGGIMAVDIPNVFVQTEIALYGQKIIMRIRGQLVYTLIEIFPGV